MRIRFIALCALLGAVSLSACSMIGGGDDTGSIFKSPLATKPGTVDVNEAAALISQYRATRGLPPVTVDPTLMQIATVHARRMAAANKMTHVLPGEGSFQQRLAADNFQASMAAENVAAGQKNLAEVLEAWRKSPGHNANLLLAGVSRIGIAVSLAPGSEYKLYWALVLGERYVPRPGEIMGGPNAGPYLPAAPGVTLEIH